MDPIDAIAYRGRRRCCCYFRHIGTIAAVQSPVAPAMLPFAVSAIRGRAADPLQVFQRENMQ